MQIGILSKSRAIWATNRLIETATQLGHEPIFIPTLEVELSFDKDRNPTAFYGEIDLSKLDVVIPRIGSSLATIAGRILRQLELLGVPSTLNSSALELGKDKYRTLQALSQAGMTIPRTTLVQTPAQAPLAISTYDPPYVLKFLDGTQGLGVLRAEDAQQAKEILEAFLSRNIPMLVQEYIETNNKDQRYLVLGDRVVAAMEREAIDGEWRANYHRGAKVHLLQPSRQQAKYAVKAAHAINAEIAGVDILHTSTKDYVIEINTSPGFSGLEIASSKDVAKRIVRHAVSIAEANQS